MKPTRFCDSEGQRGLVAVPPHLEDLFSSSFLVLMHEIIGTFNVDHSPYHLGQLTNFDEELPYQISLSLSLSQMDNCPPYRLSFVWTIPS